jgi:hypothetical protein
MYFWRIRRLRQTLRDKTLSQSLALSYTLAVTFFYTLLCLSFSIAAVFVGQPLISIYILIFFATKFFGIPWCFYCNGGINGVDFMQRYFSLAWVQILRFFVFGILLLIISLFILEAFIGKHILQSPHFIFIGIFLLLWQLVFYWRLGEHFLVVSSEVRA